MFGGNCLFHKENKKNKIKWKLHYCGFEMMMQLVAILDPPFSANWINT